MIRDIYEIINNYLDIASAIKYLHNKDCYILIEDVNNGITYDIRCHEDFNNFKLHYSKEIIDILVNTPFKYKEDIYWKNSFTYNNGETSFFVFTIELKKEED